MLAELDQDGVTLRLVDVASGQLLHTIEAPAIVNSVAFSPQGDRLAVSGQDNIVRLWDVPGGQPLHALEGHTSWVWDVAFTPDGRTLATGSADDGTVRLWDTASGQLRHMLALNNVGPVAFSPDGRQLAVVSGGYSLHIGGSKVLFYDTATGQLLRTLGGYNITLDVAFTPDGHSLIAAGGYEVHTWDVHSGQLRPTQESDTPVQSVAVSPDGQLMAWGGGEQQYAVQMWDIATGQLLYMLEEQAGVVHKVLFSPDGQLLATWSDDGLVRLWQANTGELLFSQPANHIAFHPNGRLLAINVGDVYVEESEASVQLWDVDTFTLVRSFAGLGNPVTFSADGHIVASSNSVTMGLWDSGTGELLYPFTGVETGFPPNAQAAILSPDGRILASSDFFGYLRLWDMSTGQTLWGSGSADYATSVAFSPDGRLLATDNQDGTVGLWGLPSSTP
jgi:WD40 repeat protein